MVKVTTGGFTEEEIKAFFEKYVEGLASNKDNFRRMLSQSMSQAKVKVPLTKIPGTRKQSRSRPGAGDGDPDILKGAKE